MEPHSQYVGIAPLPSFPLHSSPSLYLRAMYRTVGLALWGPPKGRLLGEWTRWRDAAAHKSASSGRFRRTRRVLYITNWRKIGTRLLRLYFPHSQFIGRFLGKKRGSLVTFEWHCMKRTLPGVAGKLAARRTRFFIRFSSSLHDFIVNCSCFEENGRNYSSSPDMTNVSNRWREFKLGW